MKITINKMELDKEYLEAIIKIEGNIMSSFTNPWELQRIIESNVKERVVEAAVEQYLTNNLSEIMTKIDQTQILNMIVLRSAERIVKN